MTLNSFGYRGNFVFTPPRLFQSADKALTILATPYGSASELDAPIQSMITEFESQISDPDSTSAYAKLTCLTPIENTLYTSVQFLNDKIYSEFNRERIQFGCDLFCAYKKNNLMSFVQIGWPLIVLNQDNKNTPISSDYSFAPKDKESGAFLPTYLLGLESSVNLKVQTVKVEEDSQILLLKSNENPDSLLTLYPSPLEQIARSYVDLSPDQGFWLGSLQMS